MSKTSISSNLPPAFGQPPRPDKPAASPRSKDSVLLQGAKALASLKLTVILFSLSIILVFCGTLAQIDEGIFTVVTKYFRWFYVWVPFQIFFPRLWHVPGGFPFPGGLTIGSALLINLLAAHALRFKLSFKRSGIIILHAGLIVMMLGELITGQLAVESSMTIENGATVNYVEERGKTELAFIRHMDKKTDDVVVIPGKKLQKAQRSGDLIRSDDLPVDVRVEQFMVNSTEPDPPPADFDNPATAGDGKKWRTVEKREGTGVDAEQRLDIASAYVSFWKKGTDEKLGTYLVSVWFSAFTDQPQQVEVDGQQYDIYLRFKREYKPYAITLQKFTHEVYPGTQTPKNFASTIHLVDPNGKTDMETTISMNNPLRHNGETFYQSGFLPRDQGTILQVVRNPGWTMPYLSCLLVALGMLIQFGITLWGFLRKRWQQRMAMFGSSGDWTPLSLALPGIATGAGLIYIVMAMMPPEDPPGAMRLHDFGKLPIVANGRTKPLQTEALNDLMMISNKHTFKGTDKEYHDAITWFLEVTTSRLRDDSDVESYEVFRIDNEQVLNLLGLPNKPEFFRYSVKELAPKIGALEREAGRAEEVERGQRTLYDNKILELARRLQIYMDLVRLESPRMVPPRDGQDSRTLLDAVRAMKETGREDPDAVSLGNMLVAYAHNRPEEFNKELDEYHARLEKTMPTAVKKAEFEVFYNDFEPFYHCAVLYVVALLLGKFSWLGWKGPLSRSAFFLCLLTFFLHTWAIGARMYLQDRPPVTNLYSSAIFVGWACVLLGLITELIFRDAFGSVLAAFTGFLSVIIAHNLATDGDTLEMMQAVLDTNFWLATHVVCINVGYAGTIAAGGVGALFILAAVLQYFTGALQRETFLELNRRMYGILCFATLTSFVGTMLGGIWADQSWGRFWGWDPKENGALMIVIMNALILHARWAGLVQQRGMAVLGLCGNILVGWSWFGVNLLGVGLHSYGFLEGTRDWLVLFILSQVALAILGMMPFLDCWKKAGVQPVKLPPPDSPVLRKRR